MTACDRFEREGLLAVERGETLDEHFSSCPDCASSRSIYERLEVGIAQAAAQIHPPLGWQARVRREIDQRRTASRWRKPWLLIPAGLAAAALALVFVLPRGLTLDGSGALTAPRLTTRVVTSGETFRSEDYKPGDRIALTGTVGSAPSSELRIYRNDTDVVLACSTEPPCERSGDTLTAETVLDLRGSYQAVVLVSEGEIPEATGVLDLDLDRALEAGALIEMGDPLTVR